MADFPSPHFLFSLSICKEYLSLKPHLEGLVSEISVFLPNTIAVERVGLKIKTLVAQAEPPKPDAAKLQVEKDKADVKAAEDKVLKEKAPKDVSKPCEGIQLVVCAGVSLYTFILGSMVQMCYKELV